MTAIPLPPSQTRPNASIATWLKKNLFNSVANSVISVILIFILAKLALGAGRFIHAFFFAQDGLALEIVRRNLNLFVLGRYPLNYQHLPRIAFVEIMLVVALVWGMSVRTATDRSIEAGTEPEVTTAQGLVRRFWPVLAWVGAMLALTQTIWPTVYMIALLIAGTGTWFLGRAAPAGLRRWSPLIMFVGFLAWLAIMGGVTLDGFGLNWAVGWDDWQGLQLNLIITVIGISAAFPLGIILAIGRRSQLPFIKFICITFIEFVRGVPMISLLLLGQFLLGFAWPSAIPLLGETPAFATRASTMIALFTAAYIAEIIRGGLQAVPKGQLEAGQALGLSAAKNQRLIILPQALRAVIPAMVGQFISLFKDTSLLTIIGMLNALQWSRVIQAQPDFVGKGLAEYTLPFVGLFFWVFSFNMSKESRRLESKLGVGER